MPPKSHLLQALPPTEPHPYSPTSCRLCLGCPHPLSPTVGRFHLPDPTFRKQAPPYAGPTHHRRMLTGALLDVASLLERVAAQLAMEVVLPELGKPDVAPVVVKRAAGEVSVEPWQEVRMSEPVLPTRTQTWREPGPGREGAASDLGPRQLKKKKSTWCYFMPCKTKRAGLGSRGTHKI